MEQLKPLSDKELREELIEYIYQVKIGSMYLKNLLKYKPVKLREL